MAQCFFTDFNHNLLGSIIGNWTLREQVLLMLSVGEGPCTLNISTTFVLNVVVLPRHLVSSFVLQLGRDVPKKGTGAGAEAV